MIGNGMDRKAIERLREQVTCAAVLENAQFAVDAKESTRRAVKYRRGGEIIIVTHKGRGWFDPLSDRKGDVFELAKYLDRVGFREGFDRVAELVGFMPSLPASRPSSSKSDTDISLSERWQSRRVPRRGSPTWCYLSDERALPSHIISGVVASDRLREGPHGSMWAAHTDEAGAIVGWEARGPRYRGFASGGSKILFRLGMADALRICVVEAAIDAMSLAAIEGLRDGTLYLSTGGGWSPATEDAIRGIASRQGTRLVSAQDANSQGDQYAERVRTLADEVGCEWMRLRPPREDWNDTLRAERRGSRRTLGKM